jgi:hypothetical protein
MGLNFRRFRVTEHAHKQCAERAIETWDAQDVAENGEIIDKYPQARPFPCCLILGWVGGRPLHVTAALDWALDTCILITAYWPDPALWSNDFRARRQS